MGAPLKDIPQFGLREHTHKVFVRIAKNRGISMSELGRHVIEEFISKEIHDAKLVLGMDDDNIEQAELDLGEGESRRIVPKGRR